MVKNYKDYIKEHLDIDPFDEEDWEIDNLSPLLQIVRKKYGNKPYDEITELYCSYNQLTSLKGIENLVNLEEFDCGDNQLTSLEEVENLVNLKEFHCYNNQLTSLKGIENLVNLKFLSCDNNQPTSLEGIENLVNLKELWCNGNNFNKVYKNHLKNYCKNKNISLII